MSTQGAGKGPFGRPGARSPYLHVDPSSNVPARNVRCPRCATVVTVGQGRKPVCRKCGFGSQSDATIQTFPTIEEEFVADAEPELNAAIIRPAWTSGRLPPPLASGRPRRFFGILWLSLITLGIYLSVYFYKVYGELDRQHGRPHHKALFWLSFIPALGLLFAIMYHAKEIPQMQGYRQMRGMGGGVTRLSFFLWATLGTLIVVGPFIALYKLNKSARQLWFRIRAESERRTEGKANTF